jgi:hypothetical protein
VPISKGYKNILVTIVDLPSPIVTIPELLNGILSNLVVRVLLAVFDNLQFLVKVGQKYRPHRTKIYVY